MYKHTACLLLAVLLFAGCTEKDSQPDTTEVTPEAKQKQQGKPGLKLRIIKRVIDGTTIELDGEEKVRLIGVSSPEAGHSNMMIKELSQKAYDFTCKAVDGTIVWLEYDEIRKDKDGVTMAYVHYIKPAPKRCMVYRYHSPPIDTFLNEEIIRQGYGRVDTEYPFKYKGRYRKLEREARKAEKGLWGNVFEEDTKKPGKEAKTGYIVAAFSSNSSIRGDAPLEVKFTDQSGGEVAEWHWDFDGNGTTDSNEQNPTYVYTIPGIYDVRLLVTNDLYADSMTRTDYIEVK